MLAGCQTPGAVQDEIPLDPQVRLGQLSNGLTYYIRANKAPSQQAELVLVVNAGSVLERDDQLGLAHFVEHMAFNGTTDYPGNRIIEVLEELGISFGAHANAYTSFDETVYFISVPTDEPQKLRTGLNILAQWAHAVTFEAGEIEKERGVVLEEWRLSRGSSSRIRDEQLPVLLRGSRYADRLPIGDPEIIQNFDHTVLRDFYRTWYRPDLMAVIAVGDFASDEMEALINQFFGSIPAPAQPTERPAYRVPSQSDTRFSIVFDPEARATRITLFNQIGPFGLVTKSDVRARTVEALYSEMFSQRMERIALDPQSPFLSAFSGLGNVVDNRANYALSLAETEADKIATGLEALVIETRRVAEHGFTESELERAKQSLLRNFQQGYNERATRESADYIREYVEHFLQDVITPGIEYELRLAEELLPEIDAAEVSRLAEHFLQSSGRTIWVSGPLSAGVRQPDEADLRAAIARAMSQPVAAYIDQAEEQELISTPPLSGRIVSETRRDDIATITWQLSNGGRIIVRPTDFSDDEVLFEAYSWGGTSQVEYEEWQSARDAAMIVLSSGIAALDSASLNELLSDKQVNVQPYIGPYSEGLSGSASSQDLETLIQLIYLYFSAPRMDEDAFANYIRRLTIAVEALDRDPFSQFGLRIQKLLSGDHLRAQPHTPESVAEIDHGRAIEFYRSRFADFDDFTLLFVGDIDLNRLRSLVETYLAGLPSLPDAERPRDLQVKRPSGRVRDVVRAGREQQSVVSILFHGPYSWSRENNLHIDALASVLDIVLNEEIREELGGTYSISASSNVVRLPRPEYFVRISFGAAPQRVDALIERVLELVTEIRAGAIKPEWITRVRNTRLNEYRVALEDNRFWISSLRSLDRNELDAGLLLTVDEQIGALTPEIIGEAARNFLNPERYLQVVLLPEEE